MLPRDVGQLIVAGRHYSATSSAQRMSREIPPCMAMGEAAGMAAALALEAGTAPHRGGGAALPARRRAPGARPRGIPPPQAPPLKAPEWPPHSTTTPPRSRA